MTASEVGEAKAWVRVFVYGTLMPGQAGYSICAPDVVHVCPAIAIARLYQLPFGYPAIMLSEGVPDGLPQMASHRVHGFLLDFANSTILHRLDAYEQHDPQTFARYAPNRVLEAHQYRRVMIPTFTPTNSPLGNAWAYSMTLAQIEQLGGVLIQSGRWHPLPFCASAESTPKTERVS